MKSTRLVGISFGDPIVIGIVCFSISWRRLELVLRAIEHHSGTCREARAVVRSHQVRVYRLQAHLVVECADEEFANGDLSTVRKERSHAQIGIDAAHLRSVDLTIMAHDD